MPDDPKLLTLLQSENPTDALAILFETYADRIYRLALGLLADPLAAEDVVQETFLSVIRHRGEFQGRSSLGTWIYRIAYNASQDRLRKKGELPLPSDEMEDEDETAPMPQSLVEWRWTPEALLEEAETRQALDEAIQSLSSSLRAVFLLRDVEDLSTEETAETLGISPSAVKVRLHRARLELRERLTGYFTGVLTGGE